MKKLGALTIVLLLCYTTYAQKGLHVGLFGGPQASMLLNKQDSDNGGVSYANPRWKSGFGLTANYHFTDGVGAGIELLYSRQGGRYKEFNSSPFIYERRLNYLKLPILLFFNTNSESVVMFNFRIGPQFAFLTKANGYDSVTQGTTSIKSSYKGTVIGAVMGIGLSFNVTEYLNIGTGLRLDGMFTDAVSDATATENPLFDASSAINIDNPKYFEYTEIDILGQDTFAVDITDGTRGNSYNVTGMIEFSVKYILRTGR